MKTYNEVWVSEDSINYEYDHPDYGRIPSTCASWDPNSSELFKELSRILGQYIPKELTLEEVLWELPQVSHQQFVAALIVKGVLSEDEGVAWILGTIPETFLNTVNTLPESERLTTKLQLVRPNSISPRNLFYQRLYSELGKSDEELVDLFKTASEM